MKEIVADLVFTNILLLLICLVYLSRYYIVAFPNIPEMMSVVSHLICAVSTVNCRIRPSLTSLTFLYLSTHGLILAYVQ